MKGNLYQYRIHIFHTGRHADRATRRWEKKRCLERRQREREREMIKEKRGKCRNAGLRSTKSYHRKKTSQPRTIRSFRCLSFWFFPLSLFLALLLHQSHARVSLLCCVPTDQVGKERKNLVRCFADLLSNKFELILVGIGLGSLI